MKAIAIFLIGFLMMGRAHAGLLLEPMLAYPVIADGEFATNPPIEYEIDTLMYGLGIGYQASEGLMVAARYILDSGTTTLTSSSLETEFDYKGTNLGVLIGYSMPESFRFYLAYAFQKTAEITDSAGAGNEYSGTGFSLGVGYNIVEYIALGIEYHMYTYDEIEDVQTGLSGSISPEYEENFLTVNLSFPFNVGN